MKRVFNITILFTAIIAVFASCSKDPENTIVNLQTAIIGEINANAAYKAYQAKAEDEGYWKIANLFEAAAAAENIHVKNHKAVLKKLGEPEFVMTAALTKEPIVKSTAENLQNALAIENHEYEEVYPGFIRTAQKEKCGDAVDTFTWANLAEENHSGWFEEALDVLQKTESDKTFTSVWFVCAQCGGLFKNNFSKCRFCQAETEKQYFKPLVFEARY